MAGQLCGNIMRKWQKREGTLSCEGMILEETVPLQNSLNPHQKVRRI